MQKDLGLVLREAVAKSNMSITGICDQLKKERSWLYYQFRRKNIPIEILVMIGAVIRHDFTDDVPELKRISSAKSFSDSNNDTYGKNNAEFWKTKYYTLLEDHLALMKQQNPIQSSGKKPGKTTPRDSGS